MKKFQYSPQKRIHHTFTLIELLVVIAIIAILAAMLFSIPGGRYQHGALLPRQFLGKHERTARPGGIHRESWG